MKLSFSVLICLVAVVQAGDYKVCYFTNWSQNRTGAGKFTLEDVDPSLCSHLVFAIAKMQDSKLIAARESDEGMTGLYMKFNELKKKQPDLKTLLFVEGSKTPAKELTKTLASVAMRKAFIESSIEILQRYAFDGIQLDFQNPRSQGSIPMDKLRYTLLVKEFRDEITARNLTLLLTYDAGCSKNHRRRYVDFVGLISFDFNGPWNSVTGFTAPLYSTPGDNLNLDWAAKYVVSLGLDKSKLVVGLAAYGRCFKLAKANINKRGSPTTGPCPAGEFTKEVGFMSHYEICTFAKLASMSYSSLHKAFYLTHGKLWVSYENEGSFKSKRDYIKSEGYGGWGVWSLDLDDFTGGFCGGEKYPLMKSLTPK